MPQAVPVLAAIGSGSAVAGAVIVGTTAVSTYAAVESIKTSKKSAAAAQQAAQTQVKLQTAQANAARRSAIRRSIVQRSQLRAQAEAAGVTNSSAFFGGTASLGSQLGTNIGQSTYFSGLGARYTSLTGEAAYQQSRSNMFGAVSSLGFGFARGMTSFAANNPEFFAAPSEGAIGN